jgi:hypothetical protein
MKVHVMEVYRMIDPFARFRLRRQVPRSRDPVKTATAEI